MEKNAMRRIAGTAFALVCLFATTTPQARPAGEAGAIPAGRYEGGVVITTAPTAACPGLDVVPRGELAMVIDVTSSTASPNAQVTWATSLESVCTIGGAYDARGVIEGPLGCGRLGEPFPSGTTAEVSEITPSAHGFAAALHLRRAACTYAGHIGGVRLP
jgi:hypothetical protein